jgi:Tetratricopeptide repeat
MMKTSRTMGQAMRQAFIPLLVVLAVVVSRPAAADPKTSGEWFNVGDNHYNLGNFEKAIEAFRKAFELEKDEALKPIYLYNIAQAYRQAGDCDNAVFFYKRFLSLKNSDTKKPLSQSTRDDIQKRISEQEKLCAEKNSTRDKPPEGTMRPEKGEKGEGDEEPGEAEPTGAQKPTQVAAADAETEESEPVDASLYRVYGDQPRTISLRLGAGLGVPRMSPVEVANQFSATVLGGYPIPLAPKVGLDVGAGLSLSPLQWTDDSGGTQTSLFITAVANASLRVEVMPKLTLRGDVGLGALFFTNVTDENPFTMGGQAAEGGALTMFHARGGLSAEYAVASSFTLWASPITVGYSPAKEGLIADAIVQLSFLAGVGYKL